MDQFSQVEYVFRKALLTHSTEHVTFDPRVDNVHIHGTNAVGIEGVSFVFCIKERLDHQGYSCKLKPHVSYQMVLLRAPTWLSAWIYVNDGIICNDLLLSIAFSSSFSAPCSAASSQRATISKASSRWCPCSKCHRVSPHQEPDRPRSQEDWANAAQNGPLLLQVGGKKVDSVYYTQNYLCISNTIHTQGHFIILMAL